jgi:hypothetical protein
MLKQKQAGMPVRKEAPVSAPSTVVNLMDTLRRSVQERRPTEKKGKTTEKVKQAIGEAEGGVKTGSHINDRQVLCLTWKRKDLP